SKRDWSSDVCSSDLLFPPERTLLTCANNHAGEYGWDLAAESQRMLEARGFRVVGRADEPAALVDGRVLIAVGTDWTNRRCGYARSEERRVGKECAIG